jgi:hypothetical protein
MATPEQMGGMASELAKIARKPKEDRPAAASRAPACIRLHRIDCSVSVRVNTPDQGYTTRDM